MQPNISLISGLEWPVKKGLISFRNDLQNYGKVLSLKDTFFPN